MQSLVLAVLIVAVAFESATSQTLPAEAPIPFTVKGNKNAVAETVKIAAQTGLTPLDPVGIYGSMEAAQQCMALVRERAARSLNFADTLPSCLRMSFHDSAERSPADNGVYEDGTGGANGSVLNELDDPQDNLGNFGLQSCHSFMRVFVPMIREIGCPELTFADAIQIVASVAIEMAGGPAVPLLPGRPDCVDCFDDANGLPSECFTLDELIDFWAARNMSDPLRAAIALNGAHNLGNVRSTTAHDRNSFLGFSGQGPTCIGNPGPLSAKPNTFDNHYYEEVLHFKGRAGYLFSDKVMLSSENATAIVREYVDDVEAFYEDWTIFFQEMGLIGIDTRPAGFDRHDGFVPGGPIGRILPMEPNPGNGFFGTDRNYTFEIQDIPSTLSGSQGGGGIAPLTCSGMAATTASGSANTAPAPVANPIATNG